MSTTSEIGRRGEDIAAGYLEEKGYRIMARNYRFEKAEVDLVCFQPNEDYETGGDLVFVEVKTRTNLNFGYPEDAVDDKKKKLIYKAADAWLHENKMDGCPARFDIIAIMLNKSDPEIEHIESAFSHFTPFDDLFT